jgi:mono/diheme cytochrome c family protein
LGVAGFRSLCALCALYALCVLRGNATAQQGVANPFQGDAQAVDEGREIYNRTCTTCHGADGAGSEMGPALGAPARRYALATDAQIVDAIKNGILCLLKTSYLLAPLSLTKEAGRLGSR